MHNPYSLTFIRSEDAKSTDAKRVKTYKFTAANDIEATRKASAMLDIATEEVDTMALCRGDGSHITTLRICGV